MVVASFQPLMPEPRALGSLLTRGGGVLEAETSRAKVHFAVPFKSLRFLFPRL